MQHRGTGQSHRQSEATADRFGKDLSEQDHQDGEADGKQRQRHAAAVHAFKQPGGIAPKHQAAKDVEAVVGNHQHGQGASEALSQLCKPAGTSNRTRTGGELMDADGINREQRCFHARAEG